MRQALVHGYVLHARAFKENSRIIRFFSQEYGMLHAVCRSKCQQFVPYQAFVSGKSDLKQISALDATAVMRPLYGKALYAGMYINELLVNVIAIEDQMPYSYAAYQQAVNALNGLMDAKTDTIKRILRQFEHDVLKELGFGVDFKVDNHGDKIDPTAMYWFDLEQGLVKNSNVSRDGDVCRPARRLISGEHLVRFNPRHISQDDCDWLMGIFKPCINQLLGSKPLKSRALWQSLYGEKPHWHHD